MTNDQVEHAARRGRLTDREFTNLSRNVDGAICDLPSVYYLITDKQREKLSEDDWSRMDGLEEEMRCMVAEL